MKNDLKVIFLSMIFYSYSHSIASSYFGVKMGMASSKFELKFPLQDHIYYNQNRIGPTMGIYYRVFDFNFINLESELYYIQKGGEEKFGLTSMLIQESTDDYIINDVQFDYLQLQINMRPNYPIKDTNIYGIIGISINYLLSVKNGASIFEDYRDFTISYSVGAGVEIDKLFDHSILLEFLISSDITNIYSGMTNTYNDLKTEYKFQTYIIRLGFGIIQ